MINLTVIQLLQCGPALRALAAQPHKGRVAFRIRRMTLALQPLIQAAATSSDSLINDANSELLENGDRKIKPEYEARVLADPLFAEVVPIDVEPLSSADLEDAIISPEQIAQLGPLLKED